MSTETTNKKIKIDNGTTFGRTYTDKAIDAKLPTDLIASANKLSLSVGNAPLGNGVNLDGFTYDEATKTLKVSGGESIPVVEGTMDEYYTTVTLASAPSANFILHIALLNAYIYMSSASDIYYGSLITGEPDGGITIMAFVSKKGSPTILNLTQSTFNPNNIPDININPNNLMNMIITDGVDNIDFSSETLVVVLGHFAHFHLFNITGIKSLQVFGTGNDAIDFNSGLLAFACQGVAVVEGYHARQKGKCLVSLCRFKKPSGVNSIYRFLCIVFAYGAVSNHFHLFDFLHFVAQDQPDNADGIRSVNRYYGIKVLIEFAFYRHCYVVTSSLLRGIADYSHSLGVSLHPLGNSTII